MAGQTRILAMLFASSALDLSAGLAVSPNFDTFVCSASGVWTGANTRWSRSPATLGRDALEVSGFAGLDPFALASTSLSTQRSVEEVIRSCGGAVQGVKELTTSPLLSTTTPDESVDSETLRESSIEELYLNRADDGFCSFNDGSWFCATSDGFEASLQHSASVRRRFSVKLASDGSQQLVYVEAALEIKQDACHASTSNCATGTASAEAIMQAQAANEIEGALAGQQLALAVDAEVWRGGATEATVSVTRHGSSAWVAARAKWASSEAPLEGGRELLPELGAKDALLPSMAYVLFQPGAGTLELVSLLPSGRKVLTRTGDVPDQAEAATTEGEVTSPLPPLSSLALRTASPLDPLDAERGWDWDDDERNVEEHGHEHGHENE